MKNKIIYFGDTKYEVTKEQHDTIEAFAEAVTTLKVDNIEVCNFNKWEKKGQHNDFFLSLNYRIKPTNPEQSTELSVDRRLDEINRDVKRLFEALRSHDRTLENQNKVIARILEILPSARIKDGE